MIRELKVNSYYMVLPEDSDEPYQWRPALYIGNGFWKYIGDPTETDWPLKGIGAEIFETKTGYEVLGVPE